MTAKQGRDRISFPRPMPLVKYFLSVTGYVRGLHKKYTLPGFVEVSPSDKVMDCGAYVGGFSLAALQAGASRVFAVEPAPATLPVLRANVAAWPNVTFLKLGLYNRNEEMTFNISSSSVEHSLLTPDDGDVVSQVSIAARRLDWVSAQIGGVPDFIKIEAEGVEAQIVEGLGDLRPARLAIDVSPEQDGESPAAQISDLLSARGYELRQRGHLLFARTNTKPRRPQPFRQNKVIYTFWLSQDGRQRPPVVDVCLDRWQALNPDWQFDLIDEKRIASILSRFPIRRESLSLQAQSDIVRTWYLFRQGGVWVDGTTFPTRPLESFLPDMRDDQGFAAYSRGNRPATWFLAGSPESDINRAWWREIVGYWSMSRSPLKTSDWLQPYNKMPGWFFEPDGGARLPYYPYFWVHQLFNRALRVDPLAMKKWTSVERPSGEAGIVPHEALADVDLLRRHFDANAGLSAVHKLEHRNSLPAEVIEFLKSFKL